MIQHVPVILMLMLSGFALGTSSMMVAWNTVDGRGPWGPPIVCFVLGVIFCAIGIRWCLAP